MTREELVRKIDAAVEALAPEYIAFLQDLCRIPTQNPPGNNYTEYAHFVGDKMESLGMDVTYVEVPEERLFELAPMGQGLPRVSVIGRAEGEAARPNIHFTGHLDVVPEGDGWTYPPYGAEIHDGKIYARGASDMKSGVAAQIYAYAAIKAAGIRLKGTYTSSTTPDEETGGEAGAGYLVEQGYLTKENTDYCVVTECLGVDKVCLGHRGTYWFEVQLFGKQSHGSMPSEAVPAIEMGRALLDAIDRKIRPLPQMQTVSDLPIDPPASRRTTLANTYFITNEKVNTVAGFARLGFDWRLTPEYSVEWARQTIRALLEELKATVPHFEYKLHELNYMSPSLCERDAAVVQAFRNAGGDVLGEKLDYNLSPGFTDQRHIMHVGGVNETIMYGPGPLKVAHKADEYQPIEDYKQGAKIMALAACELLGVSE